MRRRQQCCCVPITVDPAGGCDMTGCDQSSTDGTGMTLQSTPHGGTSSLATDADYGRPGPGWKLASTQGTGQVGTYSVVLLDDPLASELICVDSDSSICGEFLHTSSGTSLRVWPCAVQSGTVFVLDAAGYTVINNPATWQAVSGNFGWDALFYEVTAYGDNSITTGSAIDDSLGAADVQIGFLIQARGTDSVEYDAYLDNVCLKEIDISCGQWPCLSCYGNVTLQASGNVATGCSGDYLLAQNELNAALIAGIAVVRTSATVWEYQSVIAVTGGTVNLVITGNCGAADMFVATATFKPTGGGFPWAVVSIGWKFTGTVGSCSPTSPDSVREMNFPFSPPGITLGSASLLTITPS